MYPLRDDDRRYAHLSEIDRLLQRACGALGRLHAEQVARGLALSSPPHRRAAPPPQTAEQYAAVAAALDAANSDNDDGELRDALDAALVAQYPGLQRLRDAVAADGYADDDETAPLLSRAERDYLRFMRWLLRRGRLSEWRSERNDKRDASG
jgi:hypothetical protein